MSTPGPDHPRIRGEHPLILSRACAMVGSSPHTRGALSHFLAGSAFPQDHPRIRGEHEEHNHRLRVQVGSSPHTRGALMFWTGGETERGIIPAYAGSTSAARVSCPRSWDHPRIRGEHGLCNLGPEAHPGSSPHTRGALDSASAASDPSRIIPAYAGSTCHSRVGDRNLRDHPRIRGEHSSRKMTQASRAGSSPHTRGARSRRFPAR